DERRHGARCAAWPASMPDEPPCRCARAPAPGGRPTAVREPRGSACARPAALEARAPEEGGRDLAAPQTPAALRTPAALATLAALGARAGSEQVERQGLIGRGQPEEADGLARGRLQAHGRQVV